MSETYAQGTPTATIRIRNDLVRTVQEVHLAKASIDEIADAVVEKLKLSSAQPEIIRCKDCIYAKTFDDNGIWCDRLTGTFKVEKEGFCKWAKI